MILSKVRSLSIHSRNAKPLLVIGILCFNLLPVFANEGGKIIRSGLEALVFFGGLLASLLFFVITLTYGYPRYNFFTALNILVFIVIFKTPKLIAFFPSSILIGLIGLQFVAAIGITIVKLADKRAKRLKKRL